MTIQEITTVLGVQLTNKEIFALTGCDCVDGCDCDCDCDNECDCVDECYCECACDYECDCGNDCYCNFIEKNYGLIQYSITHDVSEKNMKVIGLAVCSYSLDDMKCLVTHLDDNFENLKKTVTEQLKKLYGSGNIPQIGLYTIQDDCGCCS